MAEDRPEPSEDDYADQLPAPGPLSQACPHCRVPGGLVIERRMEWAEPPPGGWPQGVKAAKLAVACRGCGSDFLSTQIRLTALPRASLAGAQPKLAMREMPWVKCETCQKTEAAKMWAWMACSRCGAEFRAEVSR